MQKGGTVNNKKNPEVIVKQGMLRKQGGQYKSWKDRWFTLTKEHFSYYKSMEAEEPIKRIELKEIKSCRVESAERLPSRFPFYFTVEIESRIYVISAKNEQERNEWIAAINDFLKPNNTIEQTPTQKPEEKEPTNEYSHDYQPKVYTPKQRPTSTSKPLTHEFPIEDYKAHFKTLVRNQLLSDIMFTISGTNFHAHKAIISARCPVLAKSFSQTLRAQQQQQQVPIDGVSPDIFSSILDYIYTGEVELNANNVVEIHFAAVAYSLSRLQHMCECFIRDNIDVSNTLVMLVAASKLKEEELLRFLLGYMKDVTRYTNIIKQPQASEIAKTNKDLYVNMSQVLAQPDESFHHTLDKVTIEPCSLTQDIYQLLTTLDHADVYMTTKEGEIFAHRVIIAARCGIFLEEGSLVSDSSSSSTSRFYLLRFPTLEADVIYLLLQAMYSNSITLNYLEDSYGLIELADRVQQEHIVSVCNDMMHQNLNNETALKILMVASEYELFELKKETLGLIEREAESILKRKDLRSILSQWPWNLIDIIRVLVNGRESRKEGKDLVFSEEEEEEDPEDRLESEDEGDA